MGFVGNLWNSIADRVYPSRRANRELTALAELKRALSAETAETSQIARLVGQIEDLLKVRRYKEAELLLPILVDQMRKKKALDQLETTDYNLFRDTLFKDLQLQLNILKR